MKILFLIISLALAFTSLFQREKKETLVFDDIRDGNKYEFIELNGLKWFTENLRFQMPESMCVSDDETLCAECGQFYLLEEAFAACPEGWRLPTLTEVEGIIKLEKRNKLNITETLNIKMCGRIDNKTVNKIGEQNTYWIDSEVENGDVEHWHIFHDKQETHSHNVVNAKRQFPVRCVCEME